MICNQLKKKPKWPCFTTLTLLKHFLIEVLFKELYRVFLTY